MMKNKWNCGWAVINKRWKRLKLYRHNAHKCRLLNFFSLFYLKSLSINTIFNSAIHARMLRHSNGIYETGIFPSPSGGSLAMVAPTTTVAVALAVVVLVVVTSVRYAHRWIGHLYFLDSPQIRCVAAGTLFPVQYLYLFLNQFRTKWRFTFHSCYFLFIYFFFYFFVIAI